MSRASSSLSLSLSKEEGGGAAGGDDKRERGRLGFSGAAFEAMSFWFRFLSFQHSHPFRNPDNLSLSLSLSWERRADTRTPLANFSLPSSPNTVYFAVRNEEEVFALLRKRLHFFLFLSLLPPQTCDFVRGSKSTLWLWFDRSVQKSDH